MKIIVIDTSGPVCGVAVMEEKKVLKEEETKEVSGGRHYVRGSKLLPPEKKEELLKSSVGLDFSSRHELPKEYLDVVAGGMYDDEDEEDCCPWCGGPIKLFMDCGEWVFYCAWCSRIMMGSDFWLYGDDEDW